MTLKLGASPSRQIDHSMTIPHALRGSRTARPTPVPPAPSPSEPEPVTPDSPNDPMPSYEDQPPVSPVAGLG